MLSSNKGAKTIVFYRLALGLVFLSLLFPVGAMAEEHQITAGKLIPPQAGLEFLEPIKGVLSGPLWLMAENWDPRLPALKGKELEGEAPSSRLQAPGVMGLVPYRHPAPAFSRSLLISRDFGLPFQTEPHIAVNPRDPKHIVVGEIDYNFPSISAYVSFDGGAVWEGPYQIPFRRDDLISAGDPVVGFDQKGNVYYSSISLGLETYAIGPLLLTAPISSVTVNISQDGGISWQEPEVSSRGRLSADTFFDQLGRVRGEIIFSFTDKPWMSLGPHPSDPKRDIIYVTYTEFTDHYEILYAEDLPFLSLFLSETTIKLVRSEDGGKTWSDPIAISPTVRLIELEPGKERRAEVVKEQVVQGAQSKVAPDGIVYVAWLDSTRDGPFEGKARIYLARSEDGGRTWSQPVLATEFDEIGFRPRNAFFRNWGSAFPQIAVGQNKEVYIVFASRPEDKPSDDGDIFFVRSLDGGQSFSPAKRLNQDETDRLQFFPAIAVDPKGNLHVMWGDMRDDPSETRYHIYYTRSQDRGDSWGFELREQGIREPDTRVTDFASNPNKGFPRGRFIGDYFSIAATEEETYLVWADTRLGEFGPLNQKIGFARKQAIPSPEVFLSPPAGPGGQEMTLQGFNFQPDMNVFIQVGGNIVATARTNEEGRLTTRVFVPIAGEGAHDIQAFDESGNFASASFYMEFGFGNIQKEIKGLREEIAGLSSKVEIASSPAKVSQPKEGKTSRYLSSSVSFPLWGLILTIVALFLLVGLIGYRIYRAR